MGFMPTHPGRRMFASWWKYTSRPLSFARAMDAENHFFGQGESLWLFKYIPRGLACFWTLVRRRPQFVFASNPPTFCPLVVWVYCRLFRAHYAMDSHTSAFDRPRWLFFMPLHSFLAKRAVFATTTNDRLTERVEQMGAKAITVPDIPFELPEGTYPLDPERFSVAVVCSFDVDEPVQEIFEAADRLPDVRFYVTGNPRKASRELLDRKPENVTLTGFLSQEEYAGLLREASAVLVLTKFDLTFQRGGSEAVSAGTPLITSDFPILREYFRKGTILVDNSPESITRAVETLQADPERYRREIRELRDERQVWWEALRLRLEDLIAASCGCRADSHAAVREDRSTGGEVGTGGDSSVHSE